ncbi:MAG TPA: hypothetical protein VN131_01270 [Mobilitalea sp.]|nr:hypothetical protein [Mobilitalea sp.]
MKKKPILFHKIANSHQGAKREVIGLIGTHHGVGVTHTGLMLAFYMGEEMGKKTAFLECNRHHDMALIQQGYEWSKEDELSCSFHMVSCKREVCTNQISDILCDDYECIIMDFGIDFSSNKEEFFRCSTKIVISGRSLWDRQKLISFSDAARGIKGSDTWLYFVPQTNDKTVLKISNEVGHRVYAVPINEEPTLPSYTTNHFFDSIF